MSKEAGLAGPFLSWEPMPEWDYCGYEIAIGMLLASIKQGRHSKHYTQYKSLKHLHSSYGNFYNSSFENAFTSLAFEILDSGYKQLTKCPTASVWCSKFMIGLGPQMGETHKPNLALTTRLMIETLDAIRKDLLKTKDRKERFTLIVFASYIVYSYVLSLRGSGGLMLNLASIIKGMDNQGSI